MGAINCVIGPVAQVDEPSPRRYVQGLGPQGFIPPIDRSFDHVRERAVIDQLPPSRVTNTQLHTALIAIRLQQAQLIQEIKEVKQDLKDYKTEQKKMKQAWETASGVLGFLKILAAIGIPITAIWAFIQR